MNMKWTVLALALLSNVASARTYDFSKRLGLGGSYGFNSPIFGHRFNDAADGGETYSFYGRYHFNSVLGLDGAFTKHSFEDVRNRLKVFDLTLFTRLSPHSRLTPILGAGLGVVDISNYSDDTLKSGLKVRAGLEYAVNPSIGFTFHVDYQNVNKMLFRDNLPGRAIHAVAGRLGLIWYLGGAKVHDEPVIQKVVEERPVYIEPAPQAPIVLNQDTDGDGVIDSRDKCPGTAPGAKINGYGCVENEEANVRLNIQFSSGKAVVDPAYESDLREIANFMKEFPESRIEIQGHTDSKGSKVLNKKLSQRRAMAVKNYLVNFFQANPSRITAKGYGADRPVAENSTKEGREMNRRVMAVISED